MTPERSTMLQAQETSDRQRSQQFDEEVLMHTQAVATLLEKGDPEGEAFGDSTAARQRLARAEARSLKKDANLEKLRQRRGEVN